MSKDLEKRIERLEADAVVTKGVAAMQSQLNMASARWAKVCEVYAQIWGSAFTNFSEGLKMARDLKEARQKAVAANQRWCLEMAAYLLPVLGGKVALMLAPIHSQNAQNFAVEVEREAGVRWTRFALAQPTTSAIVEKLGSSALDAAKAGFQSGREAMMKLVVERLAPKYAKAVQAVRPDDPVMVLRDNLDITKGDLNQFVQTCSDWNYKNAWQKALIPGALELFEKHPFITDAPDENLSVTAKNDPSRSLQNLIEMALWLRWARVRDEQYWQRVHDWYTTEYVPASREGRDSQVRGRARRIAVDALDHRGVLQRIRAIYPRYGQIPVMKLLDPESGMILAERETINMYVLIKYAKHSSKGGTMLSEINKMTGFDHQLLKAMRLAATDVVS